MIKALADLPGDRGLEAVDRFSSSSLETVRSKTGFMVRVRRPPEPRWYPRKPTCSGSSPGTARFVCRPKALLLAVLCSFSDVELYIAFRGIVLRNTCCFRPVLTGVKAL